MADKILKSLNFGTEDDYYFAQSADKINGVISVENGGFGATTTKEARQNIGAASEIDLDKIYDNFHCMELSETDDGKGNLTIGLVNLLNSCIPLEYLQSNGKQHIDLEIKPSDDMEFEIEYQSLATRATKLFGCENTSRSLFDAYDVGKTQATIRVFAHGGVNGGSPTTITTIAGQKTSLKLIVKNGTYSVYVNGELVATSPATGTVPNLSIFLFAVNRKGKADGGGSQIIYGCRVKKSGELVGKFKPFLIDGKPGFLNIIDKSFHFNLGTGEFEYGYSIDSYVHDGMISFADAERGLDGSILKNLVGDDYDMTITGSLPYADKGLTFNGNTDNHINVPEFTSLANTEEFTCEMAVNLTNIQATQRILYLKNFFEFFIRSGKLNSDLHFDGEPRENLQGTANIGFITFAAVFKANSYQRLFINGAKVATTSAGSPSSVPASGTIGGGSGHAFTGGSKFYNIRVYKRALTDKEIARNYEIDKVRFGLDETVSAVSTLSLDESDYSIDEDTELSE